MVEVTFTPSAADYVAVQRAMFVVQLRSRRFIGRIGLLLGLVAIGLVAIPFVVHGRMTLALLAAMGPAVAGLVGGLAVVIVASWLLLPRRAQRLFAQQRTLHHEHRTVFDATGFRQTSVRADIALPWQELLGWHVGRDMLLLYSNDLLAYFIPVDAFAPGELAQVEALLTTAGVPRR